jgi:hypothetical protein
MEKRTAPISAPGASLQQSISSLTIIGLTARKYSTALKEAQALLTVDQPGLYDQLNCGKLGKLVAYIRRGLPSLLLIASYGEYAFFR